MNEELEYARRERDYMTFDLRKLTWEDFTEEGGFTNFIGNIHHFEFSATLSGLGRWTDMIEPSRAALRLHSAVEEALTTAEFVNIPALETAIEDERLSFRFRDPDYSFELDFYGSGEVVVTREGSTLKTFHHWYTHFMPTIPDILSKAIAAFDAELHRSLEGDSGSGTTSVDEIPSRVRLLAARFTFNVVCHQFHRHRELTKSARNLDVMMENIAIRLPDESGRINKDPGASVEAKSLDMYGRMDYLVGLSHPNEASITQFMNVRAPSNSGWSGLFFTLSYTGDNYRESSSGERTPLKPEYFLNKKAESDAYVSFFRDMGLKGFIASVTEGYEFDTTSGSLA